MLAGKEYDILSKSDVYKSINLVNVAKHNQYRLAKEAAPEKTANREAMQTGNIER